MGKRPGIRKELAQILPSSQTLEQQLNELLKKKQYSKAIRRLQQSLKRDPEQKLSMTEADIWLQQGKDEFEQSRYSQAEESFRQAMTLGPADQSHYWLAKTLLAQQEKEKALALFQSAFEDKTLPKDLGGCYLKLLFLNGQADVVETLIKTKSSRFYAPHLHWSRGVLALKSGTPEAALSHFEKMGRQASPGDYLATWRVYAHQCAGQWSKAQSLLGLHQPWLKRLPFREPRPQHPAKQRLVFHQIARDPQTQGSSEQWSELQASHLPQKADVWVLELLSLIRDDALHKAAHLVLELTAETAKRYPELQALYRPLLLLGGDQAFQEDAMACAAHFWESVVHTPTFDPKLALRLHQAYDASGDHRQDIQLLAQLLGWVRQEAKRTPQDWPETKLRATLAQLYCWLADQQMLIGSYREVDRSIDQAVQLAPNSPEVIARQGLRAFSKGKAQAAIPLLTQALELGCQYQDTYYVLVEVLERTGASETLKSVRRKFGQRFGDVGVETEVEIPAWLAALSFKNYEIMEDFVEEEDKPTPALSALEIFLGAAEDEPSSAQKVTINQSQALSQWDELLRSHPPQIQVDILKAIYLVIQQHARRNQKGITALQGHYAKQLVDLMDEVPQARRAHLMILALKNLSTERLAIAVQSTLQREIEPGNTLALAHLELNHVVPNRKLGPFIEKQLSQEPQNPLLLLAQATLSPNRSPTYQRYYDQGFELARRLQDATALQAYREEDWFKAQALTGQMLGLRRGRFNEVDQLDMAELLQQMAEKMLGRNVPPELLELLMPKLQAQMFNEFYEDEDDPIFLPPPPRKSANRKRKR
ncbi:tetratricopeptide repeat protein [Lyngbya confervoides]|uniref:Tetratricopeptide repeat protein n=1 Tax=Lyngbya confervoides BDU141951 TaxID=1574623 RepID=A0ABD4T5Q2_9CYAN|nr:tetratricopeptide repeat protein [Lyngbya confervoides]MCM1984018.1 tetratricopeptide repeat protein [Lyngbya confervoides BDU141951]